MCVPLSDIPKARCLLAGAAERAQPIPKIGPVALAERGGDGAARPMGTSQLPEQPHPVPASRPRVSERFSNPNPKSDGIGAFCSDFQQGELLAAAGTWGSTGIFVFWHLGAMVLRVRGGTHPGRVPPALPVWGQLAACRHGEGAPGPRNPTEGGRGAQRGSDPTRLHRGWVGEGRGLLPCPQARPGGDEMRNFNKNTYFEAAPSLSERRGGGHTGHFSPGSGLLLHAPKSAHRGGDARGVGMKNPIFSHSGAWCSCLRVGLGSPPSRGWASRGAAWVAAGAGGGFTESPREGLPGGHRCTLASPLSGGEGRREQRLDLIRFYFNF